MRVAARLRLGAALLVACCAELASCAASRGALTPAEQVDVSRTASTLAHCQDVGRACKADGGADCYGAYDACVRDGGLRD